LATHKSAEKRARQDVRRNARNSQTKAAVRTVEKKVRSLLASDKKAVPEALKELNSKFSKAVAKGAMHKKTVARKMSRLAKLAHKAASK